MFIVVTYESIGRRLAHLMRLFAANYTIVSDKVHGSEAVSLSIQSRCMRNLIHSERVASIQCANNGQIHVEKLSSVRMYPHG